MNHDEFFRKAALAICSNLKIELAMRDCIAAMGDLVPVDRMFLQMYDANLGAMRTIAEASATEGRPLDILTVMPDETRAFVRDNLDLMPEKAVILHDPARNPVAREMLRFHGIEGWSVASLTLTTENDFVGSAVVTAEGKDRYNETHADLFSLLKGPFTVALFNTLTHREVVRLRDRLADDNRFLQQELQRIAGDEIVGADFGLKEVLRLVRQVAPTDSPVLLTGETGVGKDVVAGAVQISSPRREGPFIAVNCGAIPESLIDSELFGHEKGAFTGALAQKRGRFERAHQGTIFLDEIGEMPLSAQVRLLRVLQNREIERVGGADRIPVDIRVIAATNRDLGELVAAGKFREDLLFRLNVFPIAIPPLRERTCDIPALVNHFIESKAKELKLGNTPAVARSEIDSLVAYHWPGNVRELANVVERAMILFPEGPLRFGIGRAAPVPEEPEAALPSSFQTLDAVVADHIRSALARAEGKIHGTGGAGELLGVNPNTLRARMRKLGIGFGQNH